MIIGYACISTSEQTLDPQATALQAAGAERIYADEVSGSKRARPQLENMVEQLRAGDVVVVTKYDRLGRSIHDLLNIVETIRRRGAGFRSLAEDIDTTCVSGGLIFHVFASIAQFERQRVSECTREGLQAARKQGRVGGRPPALSPAQRDEVKRMRDEEHLPLAEIARRFKVSTKTIRRVP